MKTKLQVTGVMVFLLTTAIILTIYGAWLTYPLAIAYFDLENVVYMKSKDIAYQFSILMTYLTNPLQQVLDMPNFSSSADGLKHFRDVKYLFHLIQLVFLLTIPSAYRFYKDILKKGYGKVVQSNFFWASIFPILIVLLGVMVGFDTFFVWFHTILFPGDSTWLFNPNTDPVIYILPQEFFLHCFIAFFIFYECLTWAIWFLCGKGKK